MSENQPVAAEGASAGSLLREAREAAGLHVSTLAANLKVPVRKLEALEEDRYDELPDAVFVRALASSVCRTLKIDPAPVLQRLPQTPQPRLAQTTEGINAPFRSPSDGPQPGVMNQVSRPVLLIVVALLLAALVLIFLPMAQRGYDTVVQANRGETPAAPARPEQPTTEPAPAAGSVAGFPGAPSSAAGPVPTPAAITQAPEHAAQAPNNPNGVQLRTSASTVPQPQPAASSPAAVAAPVAAASAAPAASAPIDARGTVVFRTRAQSWVQVKDANGTTVMQKLMEAGESAGASGALPLSVTVGSAGATEVQVRGKPFDLAPLARDNVARFQVK